MVRCKIKLDHTELDDPRSSGRGKRSTLWKKVKLKELSLGKAALIPILILQIQL